MTNIDCAYFGKHLGNRCISSDLSVETFECRHPKIQITTVAECASCPFKTQVGSPAVSTVQPPVEPSKAEPSKAVMDRWCNPAGIENLYMNGHVFLQLGGPSLKQLPLEKLDQRGIITFGVNNTSANVRRTNLWTQGDSISKVHEVIWKDPAITKFIPYPKLKRNVQYIRDGGQVFVSGERVKDFPGVYAIQRTTRFRPDEWLHEGSISFGNGRKHGDSQYPQVLSIMFTAVRLCYYLGFRHVWLIGCDFTMDINQRYAWKADYDFPTDEALREKDKGYLHAKDTTGGNNAAYPKIAKLFEILQPRFLENDFHVRNCNPNSGLKVFPFVSFDEAIAEATAHMPKTIETRGWY